MGYKLEQLMCDKRYSNLCDILLGMASNDDMRKKLESILYNGEINGYSLKSGLDCRDNPRIEATRRISMAYLLIDSPDTFDYLANNNINLFHGTNSNALPTILKYGLTSVDNQKKNGISNCTGEEWSRINGERDYISFTDVLDTAINYSSLMPNNNDLSSFGVIIGTSEDDIRDLRIVLVSSSLSEIGAMGVLDTSSIKVLCVPDDKVNFVKRLVGDKNIKVMGFSGMNSRFYYFDDLFLLDYSTDLIDEYKNNLSKRVKFSNDEVREVASSRSLDKIFEIINKISSFFKGDKDDEHIR